MGVAERLMLSVWAFTMRFSKGSEKVSDSRYLGIGRSALLAGIARLRLLRHVCGILVKGRSRFND